MIQGETITLVSRVANGVDEGGDTVWKTVTETVDNVVVVPGVQANSAEANRPDGVQVAFTLYFPRSFDYRSLRGCMVRLPDMPDDYKVIGDPRPYRAGIEPTRWNMTVELQGGNG